MEKEIYLPGVGKVDMGAAVPQDALLQAQDALLKSVNHLIRMMDLQLSITTRLAAGWTLEQITSDLRTQGTNLEVPPPPGQGPLRSV